MNLKTAQIQMIENGKNYKLEIYETLIFSLNLLPANIKNGRDRGTNSIKLSSFLFI